MVVCSDLERSRGFYGTLLGLKAVGSAATYVEYALGEDTVLALYQATDGMPVRRGSLQLGFTVEDVDAFVTDARTAGMTVLQDPYREKLGRVAVVADPDGYPVQVTTPARTRSVRA